MATDVSPLRNVISLSIYVFFSIWFNCKLRWHVMRWLNWVDVCVSWCDFSFSLSLSISLSLCFLHNIADDVKAVSTLIWNEIEMIFFANKMISKSSENANALTPLRHICRIIKQSYRRGKILKNLYIYFTLLFSLTNLRSRSTGSLYF